MSFRISLTPHRRVAARFVEDVRRRLQKAYADAPGIKQTDIANALGVHRSVINRQLRGYKDMTLGRVAELSWCLGYEPAFSLEPLRVDQTCNTPPAPTFQVKTGTTDARVAIATRQLTPA